MAEPSSEILLNLVEKALERVQTRDSSSGAASSSAKPAPVSRPEPEDPPLRGLITEKEVMAARDRGVLRYMPGTIITPLARDTSSRYGVLLEEAGPATGDGDQVQRLAIGSDHGGYELKESLKGFLKDEGFRVDDTGCHSRESVDYPDFALKVATRVATGRADRGICIDGIGIGSCMAANKVPGVLAAVAWDATSARIGRSHDAANVLCLGAAGSTAKQAEELVTLFLSTAFEGGRHARRIGKIRDIERSFLRPIKQ